MATIKQKAVAKRITENHGNISKTMREVGYSKNTAKKPSNLTDSKGWEELMEEYLPDKDLAEKHQELLGATRLEHMVFPKNVKDKIIKELLESVNCNVRKIQHGDQANHVWFWAKDNIALKSGLEMAYKLKGKYAPEKIKFIDQNADQDDELLTDEERGLVEAVRERKEKSKIKKKAESS